MSRMCGCLCGVKTFQSLTVRIEEQYKGHSLSPFLSAGLPIDNNLPSFLADLCQSAQPAPGQEPLKR